MSVMLMGLVSLFTSCVDGDYYDLYDDEEILSPRSKKGKDIPGPVEVDPILYPLMISAWQEAECVACCYSNTFNVDRVTSRWYVIMKLYGEFDIDSYNDYFYHVRYCNGVDESVVPELFGNRGFAPEHLVNYCVNNNYEIGKTYSVADMDWVAFADASSGSGTHVAKVMELSVAPYHIYGYKDITISVVDQTNYGDVHAKYHVIIDDRNRFYKKSPSLRHFFGRASR